MPLRAIPAAFLLAAVLGGCDGADDGTLQIAIIDNEQSLYAEGLRLSAGAQHLRAATGSGLVALDRQGEIVPALADRWNVTEGGQIFVFRLRDGTWPDGEEFSAESVRRVLERRIGELDGTSLGLDLAPIAEIRAMAGRVIEIRLTSAVPDLLQLLAQPELELLRGEGKTGPMLLDRAESASVLRMKPPEDRGLPENEDWREDVRVIGFRALPAEGAIAGFEDGDLDVVLGGRLGSLPLVDTGPLSRGTVQLDPAIGLFGLHVRRDRGILASATMREAIAMAIDRPVLATRFNIGGWVPTTRLVAPGLPGDPGGVTERWTGLSIEQRRAEASSRLANWRAGADSEAGEQAWTLSLLIGDDPGFDLLYRELASQLGTVGIALTRAETVREADLVLVDRVARYAAPRWFLNQFNCSLDLGLCSEDADFLVRQTLDDPDTVRRANLLAEAEAELASANVYIPFGSPIRWSLVRGSVEGYAANRWAFHPLPDMAVIPR